MQPAALGAAADPRSEGSAAADPWAGGLPAAPSSPPDSLAEGPSDDPWAGAAALVEVPSCADRIAAGEIRPRVERVLVEKGERRLSLWFAGHRVRSYRVALGSEPIGDKQRQGDGRTPEGTYTIDGRNGGSEFHRSLHISYPNAADVRSAREAGADPGGEIMIHGLPNAADWVDREHTRFDWTEGCIALTNEEIDELWELVADGTPIEIRP